MEDCRIQAGMRPGPWAVVESPTWPDLSGRLVAGGHVLPVRVYFEDTDFSGIVYHASYVRWCERGRSDWLRLLGNDHRALLAGRDGREAAAFVVRRMELDFLKPARIDEVLEVQTRLVDAGAAALMLDQRIERDGAELFRAKVQVVLVGMSGRVMRLGAELRQALGGLVR